MKGVAISKLRRLPAYNEPFRRTDVRVGDAALFCQAMDRRGTPHWRGPAKIWAVDDTGAAVKFQPQTLFCGALLCVEEGGRGGCGGCGIIPLVGSDATH